MLIFGNQPPKCRRRVKSNDAKGFGRTQPAPPSPSHVQTVNINPPPAQLPSVPNYNQTSTVISPLANNAPHSHPLQGTMDDLSPWQRRGSDYPTQDAAICDLISSKFDAVITSIDGEIFSGDEKELGTCTVGLC